MNSLGLVGFQQYFFGIYIIFHGLIFGMFNQYEYDEEKDVYTGWSGKSWLLDRFLQSEQVKVIGKIAWIIVTVLFVASGIGIFGFPIIGNYIEFLILTASIIGILAYIAFFNGIAPNPYQWILGPLINLVLVFYMSYFSNDSASIMIILIALALCGFAFVFLTEIIPSFMETKEVDSKTSP